MHSVWCGVWGCIGGSTPGYIGRWGVVCRLAGCAVWFVGCGGKDDGTARVKCEEGSIAIDGECVVGGSGYEDADGGGDEGGGTGGTSG